MNEFQLIRDYFTGWQVGNSPRLGIGDDAAIISMDSDRQLVIAADTLVVDRHFPKSAMPEQIASRALAVNLSDIAAMGARPEYYTLCLTLPRAEEDWLARFAGQLRQGSEKYNCALIGGDTTKGELCISLQMIASVPKERALTRSAAKQAQKIFVTGYLGDAAGFVQANFSEESIFEPLAKQFWSPQPQLDFAQQAAQHIQACIDVSDGLIADLTHICRASQVGAKVYIDKVPVSQCLKQNFPQDSIQLALTGGDDYQLCFTAEAEHEDQLREIAARLNINLSCIGEIVAAENSDAYRATCFDKEGREISIARGGYSHF